jgi:hypothetical protein
VSGGTREPHFRADLSKRLPRQTALNDSGHFLGQRSNHLSESIDIVRMISEPGALRTRVDTGLPFFAIFPHLVEREFEALGDDPFPSDRFRHRASYSMKRVCAEWNPAVCIKAIDGSQEPLDTVRKEFVPPCGSSLANHDHPNQPQVSFDQFFASRDITRLRTSNQIEWST